MSRPLIGIIAAVFPDERNWRFLRAYEPNAKAIERAGGIPVLVPATLETETLRALYERLDGVLLPGGGDMDATLYDAIPHERSFFVDPVRDTTEMQMARWAVADDTPIFGICRGHQVFNVALGGTLIQDIPSQVETEIQHDIFPDQPRSVRLHHVNVESDSKLAQVLDGTQFFVNSLHHQSIERVAPNVRITAHAPDGIIEAAEIPDHKFALTVQWHPEDMVDVDHDDVMMRLFRAFVSAANGRYA